MHKGSRPARVLCGVGNKEVARVESTAAVTHYTDCPRSDTQIAGRRAKALSPLSLRILPYDLLAYRSIIHFCCSRGLHDEAHTQLSRARVMQITRQTISTYSAWLSGVGQTNRGPAASAVGTAHLVYLDLFRTTAHPPTSGRRCTGKVRYWLKLR